jgi:hypothetical protein
VPLIEAGGVLFGVGNVGFGATHGSSPEEWSGIGGIVSIPALG